MIICDL